MVLDTEKDLIVIKNIFKRFKDFHFSKKDVLKIKNILKIYSKSIQY